jgi:TolB-like protein
MKSRRMLGYMPSLLLCVALTPGELLAQPPPEAGARREPPARDPAAPALPPARVAVVAPLHMASPHMADRELGESLGEVLAVALADQKNLVVVERQKLKSVLEEQKLGVSGLVDPATAAKVGRLLLAELVVAGSVVESAGKLRCTVYVIAVDGQRIVGSVQIDGTHDDLSHAFLELSTKVAALAGIQLPPIKPEQLDDSPVGRLHLMRGISLYYANNADLAIVSCLRAVQFDPRLQEARLWIAKAYLRQGEKEHARIELQRLARNPAASPLLGQVKLLLAECNSRANPNAAKPAKD